MPSPAAKKRKDARQSMIDDIRFGDFDSSDFKKEELVENKFTIKKFVWKIECVNCKKEIYSLKKIRADKVLKKHITVFLDGDYKYVAPRNYEDCGIYDKFNVNWYCFDCK